MILKEILIIAIRNLLIMHYIVDHNQTHGFRRVMTYIMCYWSKVLNLVFRIIFLCHDFVSRLSILKL